LNSAHASVGRAARALLAACGFPAVLLTCAAWFALLIGYLGTFAWLFDLFANFRVQYLGLFAVSVIALTIARRRKMAIVALLGVAVTTVSMTPYFQERTQAGRFEGGFRLVTFNTWFRNDDLARIARFLEHSRADVIVLQEVDLARLAELSGMMRSYPHHVATPKVRHGLVIFSRTPLTDIEHFEIPARVTRITRAKVHWNGVGVAIIGAHLSWPISPGKARQRAGELTMIAERARRETGPVLVAGDFNLTPWSGFFARFVEQSGLADCALDQGLLGTWPSQVPPVRLRIDHCFASSHWKARNVEVGPKLGSDHLPVTVDLELTAQSDHSSRATRLMM
jgi:endonuclease/exonuclease/phosphatase (EEP) superfamily protein YafD